MPVTAATSLIEGKMQADAAKDAAGMQAAATHEANMLQKQMYDQTRADNEPWRQAGGRALGDMENADFKRDFTMNDYQADPGYEFRMREGQKALERSAAARGGLSGGASMKALAKYSQDVASQEYGNAYNRFNSDRDRRFNRLASLAGVGQTANASNAQAGMNYGNQGSANIIGGGNAAAAGRMAEGQAWAGAAHGVGQAYKDNQQTAMQGASMAGGMMMSDERMKTGIRPADSEIEEFLSTIGNHLYEYKDKTYGEHTYASPMAQELERTKLGRGLVVETPNGKMVDYSRSVATMMASLAYIHREIQSLKKGA